MIIIYIFFYFRPLTKYVINIVHIKFSLYIHTNDVAATLQGRAVYKYIQKVKSAAQSWAHNNMCVFLSFAWKMYYFECTYYNIILCQQYWVQWKTSRRLTCGKTLIKTISIIWWQELAYKYYLDKNIMI